MAHAAELGASDWGPDVYLSPGDAGRFFALAAERSPELRFAVVFVHSLPRLRARFDLGPARELFGYEPQDTWPAGCEAP